MPEPDAEKGSGLPVGEYLKSVRESRGLQLEEAARVTRISKSYLAAIEEGNFEKLPNPAYIKGFLRLYAGFLSLSGDDVVQRYESSLPPVSRPQPEHRKEGPGVEIVERAKLGGPGRWVIPALLLVLVVLAAIFLADQEEKPARPVQTAQPPPPAAPAAPPKAAVQPQRTSLPPAQPGVSPQAAPPAAAPPAAAPPAATERHPGGVVLRLRFNRDTWLSITIDDSISQRYDLKAGDVIEWKGSRAFVLDLGDGSAVEAELNGKPLKALGEPGKPAHVELKAP